MKKNKNSEGGLQMVDSADVTPQIFGLVSSLYQGSTKLFLATGLDVASSKARRMQP